MNDPIADYQLLAYEDYKMLAYVSSPKGLLKPFKSMDKIALAAEEQRPMRARDDGAIDATSNPDCQTLPREPASADIHHHPPPARTSCSGVTRKTKNQASRHSAT